MGRTIIGIDNGVTGSVAYITSDGSKRDFCPVPTKKEQGFQKKKSNITRIDFEVYKKLIFNWLGEITEVVHVLIERPFLNPRGLKATISAMRCLEATLILLEEHFNTFSYEYIDSKEWQRVILPVGIKGTPELKKASLDIGCRLFPELSDKIKKHKDADSLLIAEYFRKKEL
jgi:hypothetical protein